MTLAIVACRNQEPDRPKAQRRPNVLLVVIDAMRGDRLGVNGYRRPTTPALDRLAREGISFPHAFSNASWTKPAMATLFTSLYPSSHFALRAANEPLAGDRGIALGEDLRTMAEIYSTEGYRTGAFLVQPHLTSQLGFAQGFETFQRLRGKSAARQNELLRKWIAQPDPRPFFAWLHYLDVHWPYDRRPAHDLAAFGSTSVDPEPPKSQLEKLEQWRDRFLSPVNLAGLISRYDLGVAFVDDQLGALVSGLESQGLLADTVVVVTADHGEGFLEHGELGHGFTPYDEQIRIPLIFRLPERLGGMTGSRETVVSLVDLLPTLLDLSGISLPEDSEGTSLRGILSGREEPDRLAFTQTEFGRSVRSISHKLIALDSSHLELYDLRTDPEERQDLVAGGPCAGLCRSLFARLRAFQAKAVRRSGTGHGDAHLSQEDLEELRSLGYL
ncbi:MAG: sulfatase [Thermoanaerobaculia bacterium]